MPKILVVEDNEENRDSLARRLQRKGYNVVVAVDGKQGVEMASSEAPDVILMDLNMPEMDGWEATRRVKSAPETEAIPVIAMTAHALSGDQESAMAAGCEDYHSKPVDFTQLLSQIETILTRSAERRTNDPAAAGSTKTAQQP